MTLHLKLGLVVPAVALFLAIGQAPARAALVTTVTSTDLPQSGGGFLYTYTVMNSSSSTVGVSEFDVNVSTTADLGGLTNPTGFLALYTTGDPFVQFLSTDPSADIAPGSSGVFTFTSLVGPASSADLLRGIDSSGAPVENPGVVNVAPTATPEPATVALLGMALAALPFFGARARRVGSGG